jgi:CelD/BcsL family acetyltransferase involved in cellulose biosynthesis
MFMQLETRMHHPSERVFTGSANHPVPAHLTVEVRADVDLGHDDVVALDALIEGRPDVGVFMSRAWLAGFLEEPVPAVEPAFVLLREGETLKGLAPLAIRRTLTHTRIGFLGGGAGSDRVDLLAARGYDAACSDALVAWLVATFRDRPLVLELRDVPLDSPLWGALYRANTARTPGLTVQPREMHTLPYLDLAEFWSPTMQENPQLWGKPSLDRHRRWLERKGRIRFHLLRHTEEVLQAFETLTAMLHARWTRNGQASALDDPRARRFHRAVLPRLLAEGRLRMTRMTADDRVVGVSYGLGTSAWWGNYFLGYDREWSGRIHLGRLIFAASIEYAAREGATEFDFLKGAERVKYLWPVRTRGTVHADVYPITTGAQLLRAGSAARDAAAAMAKSAGRLFSR